jgi:hypothetical protein
MSVAEVREKTRKRLNRMSAEEVRLIQMLTKICWNSTTNNLHEGKLYIQNIFSMEGASDTEWESFLHFIKTQRR